MQLRKHAAPPLGDSFFTAKVAVPPDFTGTEATLATGPIDFPVLPPGEARLVSAGRLMSASAMTAIAKLRYMSVSFVWRILSTRSMPRSGLELCEGHHGMHNLRVRKKAFVKCHQQESPGALAGAPGGCSPLLLALGSVSLPGGATCRDNLEQLKPFLCA